MGALGKMGPSKSPGPDGFHALFFQQTWLQTCPSLVQFVKQVLEQLVLLEGTNESLLVLIPKEERPTSIKGFRPIRLCNVCIKLVSKVMVNHLRGVLAGLIS